MASRRYLVSTHSRLKAAGEETRHIRFQNKVSTHSRLKAAGAQLNEFTKNWGCFNTQPPEGGWTNKASSWASSMVSTHSRLKAAGFTRSETEMVVDVSTHSRLKAAGNFERDNDVFCFVSTHSRLKAAGAFSAVWALYGLFQHTAA